MRARQNTDLRVMRTRGQLKAALLSLLLEKTFDEIKIKEIAEKAGVNRVTYYDHYSSKEEILTELIEDVLNEYADIIEGMPVIPPSHGPSVEFMKTIRLSVGHIKKHSDFYGIMLLKNGVPDFTNRLHDQMSQSLHQSVHQMARVHPDIEFDLFVDWIIGGAIGVYKYWLQNGMRQTEEEISRQLLKIALASSQVFLPRK
ncbi:TetR/AcrR family transcriptional regulator [Paenibacillus mendelii]|uniref:TetR/AcrR family transcriptional regulator n=1 Tax=Paenibacillus mendelii TaxID=206163 RepID=A0ABV6J341_9BACL|nr:TetR/AcrR family transcriptional regulator [Paenibacillus mendelii]MCQ6559398.1 TetR/AcrR family transcriptional regulator [Paenibacillus mendelii]